jgi:hypothetical protein
MFYLVAVLYKAGQEEEVKLREEKELKEVLSL